jgi:hypothetical protein
VIAEGSDGGHADWMDGTLPTCDSTGSPRPWDPRTWMASESVTRAANEYLLSKPLAEQVAVSQLMADIERIGLPPVRSRTTTDDVPWLQQPGAGRLIAAAWNARLEGAK